MPAFRANPFLKDRIQNARIVAVMPLDVEVYKVSAGGVKELVDEYSEEAKNNIKSVLENKPSITRKYRIKYFSKPEETEDLAIRQLLKDTIALFKAVNTSIISHTYNNSYMRMPMQGIFSDKLNNFDYSLGPQISPLSDYIKADLFLFIRGGDFLSSGGRIALMTWYAILQAASGVTPVGLNAGPPHLSAALIDAKTGDVLWYNFFCPGAGYNFRNPKSVENFVVVLLKDFP